MPSIISAGTTTGTALSLTSDTSGELQIRTNNGATTAMTLTTGGAAVFTAGTVSAPAITTTGDTNTGIFFPAADTIAFTEGGVESMRIDSSGNVGIGTSSPAQRLQVQSAASTTRAKIVSELSGSVYNSGIEFARSGVSGGALIDTARNATFGGVGLAFSTTADNAAEVSGTYTERMRIDSSGNLLVGTTSGSGRVHAYRNLSNTSRGSNLIYWGGTNGVGADGHLQFTDSQANNSYFGQNNGGAYVFCNTGGVRLSSGGTSWASDSDERLKDIIEPISDALNKVSTLRTVIGKYKTDDEGTRRAFLIAQDVQAVLPEAVVAQQDEIGTLSLAYTDVIPLLVASIKELKAELDSVKAELQILKGA